MSEPSPCFEHEVTVRFHEVDRAGIVFFGRVFEYCHTAFEEFLAAAADGLASVFDQEGWGMPLVHAEADYQRPMKMGDRIKVELRVDRLGSTSITFGFTLVGADGTQRANAQLVHAFVDLERFQKRSVPETITRALEKLGMSKLGMSKLGMSKLGMSGT